MAYRWIGLLLLVGLVGGLGIWAIGFAMKPELSMKDAEKEVMELVRRAGGLEIVCREGSRVLERFPENRQKWISAAELKDFPALSRLGIVDSIEPGNRRYIKIRTGTHRNGYILEVFGAPGIKADKPPANTIEIGDCIYVHR